MFSERAAGTPPPWPEEIFTPEVQKALQTILQNRVASLPHNYPTTPCTAPQRLAGLCGSSVLIETYFSNLVAALAEEAKRSTLREAFRGAKIQIFDLEGKPITRNSSLWASAVSEFNEKGIRLLTVVLGDVRAEHRLGEAVDKIIKQSEGKTFIHPDKGCFGQFTIGAIGGTLIGIIDEIDLRTKEITLKLGPLKYQLEYEELVNHLEQFTRSNTPSDKPNEPIQPTR
ncbi:hypothetical protein [Nitrococcus mobilis]|uniref:hypothetical protein n=1 Tax=Nitrococcus mobilis TaxID=35797 RepID=UPI0012EA07F3|nr:hypothetical protein [Nitrococcus mobilis]